jgi:hypothetical protein
LSATAFIDKTPGVDWAAPPCGGIRRSGMQENVLIIGLLVMTEACSRAWHAKKL